MPHKPRAENDVFGEARLVWSIFLFVGAVLLSIVVYGIYLFTCNEEACMIYGWQRTMRINSFEECAAQGFPVTTTTPPECRVGRRVFTPETPEVL